jgi:hypothetical protein
MNDATTVSACVDETDRLISSEKVDGTAELVRPGLHRAH